jgi:hypothetical protein
MGIFIISIKFDKKIVMKKISFYLFCVIFLLSACTSKEITQNSAAAAFNSFMADNKEIVFYGGIGLEDLVNKTGVFDISGVGESIGEQFNQIKASLALNERVYFALGGPLDRDGMPKSIYFFMRVLDKEKVNTLLSENGYFFEEENGIMVAEDITSAIGFNDNLIIAVSGEYDEDVKSLLMNAFQETSTNRVNERIAENLERKGDLLLVTHLENLYSTSNTDLNRLPQEKQQELQDMVKGNHVATSLLFDKGRMILESFTGFRDNMEKFAIFDESGDVDVTSKLGPGLGYAGMSLNLDMEKIDVLIQEYNADLLLEMYKEMGPSGALIKNISDNKLASIMSGAFGVALLSKPGSMEFAKDPKMHVFAGMGKSSEMITSLFADLLAAGDVEKMGEGVYRMDGAIAKIKQNEMVMWSGMDADNSDLNFQKLDVPSNIPNFGKKPFSMYIDLSQMNVDNLGLDQVASELSTMIDYMTIEADNDGGKLVLQLKNKEDNFLNAFVKKYQGDIQAMSSQGLAF